MSALEQFADRMELITAEGAYQMLERAQQLERQGRDIIHFEAGQPDFGTFAHVREAGKHALDEGRSRYTPPSGMPALRAAIAEHASRQRDINIAPEQVVVSPGAKPTLFFSALALIQPGDEVMFPDPGFPTYRAMVDLAGGKPVPIPLLPEKGFAFDLDAFDKLINNRTRMIVLNSPANPTGGVLSTADLQHIAHAAQKYDCWVLSDEIYSNLVFDGKRANSIAALPGMQDRTIIVDGFSKSYAMTGWRLGYGIAPLPLARKLDLLITHSVGCTAEFTQLAGVAALQGPQERITEMRASYQKRRDMIIGGLRNIPGVKCAMPAGAFYAFPDISSFRRTSREIAEYLLDDAGVATLPGTAFGGYGEGYLRLSFATATPLIEKGLERMRAAFGKLESRN